MAQAFKNASAAIGTVSTDIYTCPALTTAIVIGAQVANVVGTAVALDYYWTDASNAGGTVYLANSVNVPAESAYAPVSGKLVLSAGDKIAAISAGNLELEATVSVLELT
jgi:hypothetical protein